VGRKATILNPGIPGHGSRAAGQKQYLLGRLRLASANAAKEVIVIKRFFSNIIILSVLCFFLSAMNSFAWEITLEWDPPDKPTEVTGYMVHYGTDSGAYSMSVDVGNTTSYTVSNLIDGETYYFSVVSYNATGEKSEYSNEIAAAAITSTDLSTAGVGGGCFIATAAYGSYLDPHVMVLREFRDKVLLKNKFGKMFVAFYYKNSPPIADRIRKIEALRLATRLALTPFVYAMAYPSSAAMLLLSALLILMAVVRKKKLTGLTSSGADEYFLASPRRGFMRVP